MSRSRTDVSVLIDEAHLGRLDDVVERLRSAGLHVSGVLRDVGSVTGDVDEKGLDALRKVAGVSQVEVGRRFQLPAPDAPLQ